MTSLCAPTPEMSCFGCCPPIRPAHYDPLQYAGSLRREFAENRRRFVSQGPVYRPIVGYSCWALGFLDSRGRRVGCLLHPAQNGGRDLRGLIDYGDKCRRESCVPAEVFSTLPPAGQEFWLPLAAGFNSFYYSSRRANPLFHLLGWGNRLLELVRAQAMENDWTVSELLLHRRFLISSRWHPGAHRRLFRLLLERECRQASAGGHQIEQSCSQVLQTLLSSPEVGAVNWTSAAAVHTHQLPMDADLLDFLRLGLGWRKTLPEKAQKLAVRMDRLVEEMTLPTKLA